MSLKVEIEPLARTHRRDSFECGEPALDLYLRQFARQNAEKGLGKTFVAIESGANVVLGYYTLSAGSVSFEVVPEKLPRYPIPTVHLGRLAVDKTMHGQGLGETLLIDALRRSLAFAGQIGIFAIELFAISENAKRFYLKYGFVPLSDDALHLYLPVETLSKLIQDG